MYIVGWGVMQISYYTMYPLVISWVSQLAYSM